jgi:hypothetical protein
MKNTIAVTGILLTLSQAVPYWVEALRGNVKPNIVSWFTWTLLTLIASSAALSEGNWQVGCIVLANALATGSVVLLGVWKGYAQLTRFDAVCQITAMIGLLSWPLLHTPLLAVIVIILIDAVALLPTVRHAIIRPREEAWVTYALAAAGSLCALVAAHTYTFTSVGYVTYLLLADGLVAVILLLHIMRKR